MAEAFGGLVFIFLFFGIFLAIFFVFGILPSLWVYSDAQSNSSDSPLMWALIVFFVSPVVGILLYLVFGRE